MRIWAIDTLYSSTPVLCRGLIRVTALKKTQLWREIPQYTMISSIPCTSTIVLCCCEDLKLLTLRVGISTARSMTRIWTRWAIIRGPEHCFLIGADILAGAYGSWIRAIAWRGRVRHCVTCIGGQRGVLPAFRRQGRCAELSYIRVRSTLLILCSFCGFMEEDSYNNMAR